MTVAAVAVGRGRPLSCAVNAERGGTAGGFRLASPPQLPWLWSQPAPPRPSCLSSQAAQCSSAAHRARHPAWAASMAGLSDADWCDCLLGFRRVSKEMLSGREICCMNVWIKSWWQVSDRCISPAVRLSPIWKQLKHMSQHTFDSETHRRTEFLTWLSQQRTSY